MTGVQSEPPSNSTESTSKETPKTDSKESSAAQKKNLNTKSNVTADNKGPKDEVMQSKFSRVDEFLQQKVEKKKSTKSTPLSEMSVLGEEWYDSDPGFNEEKLPKPGTEDDRWFERLTKSLSVPGSNEIMFACRQCTKLQCGRRADIRRHWHYYCKKNPIHAFDCILCKPRKNTFYGKSNVIIHLQTDHTLKGEYLCLKCFSLFPKVEDLNNHSPGCKHLKKNTKES